MLKRINWKILGLVLLVVGIIVVQNRNITYKQEVIKALKQELLEAKIEAKKPKSLTKFTSNLKRYKDGDLSRRTTENFTDYIAPDRMVNMGYAVYSRRYADIHGYPLDQVVELEPGVELVAYRLMTEGHRVEGYLTIVLDKKMDIAIPTQDYHVYSNWVYLPPDSVARHQQKTKEQIAAGRANFKLKKESYDNKLTYYNQRTDLITKGFYDQVKRGASNTITLTKVLTGLYKHYKLAEYRVSPGGFNDKIIRYGPMEVVVANSQFKGGGLLSKRTPKSHYQRITIPEKLRLKMIEMLDYVDEDHKYVPAKKEVAK